MSGIFLSYRRADSAAYAGRLGDELSRRFDRDRVFLDIATIEPGIDFASHIAQAVESCDVMLVIIGPRWLDRDGRQRLATPEDLVRMEIANALESGKRVIPVLVGGARMPRPEELPTQLRSLVQYQGFYLRDTQWRTDLEGLCEALAAVLGRQGLWSRIAAFLRTFTVPPKPSGVQREEVNSREEHVIFISHAKEDRALVDTMLATLEGIGFRCWVAFRDIPAGESSWAGAIAGAIATSRLVVVVVSRHSITSKQVLREVTIADNENISFIPFCVDQAPLTNDFKYFFSTAQRLEAGRMSRSEALALLSTTISKRVAAMGLLPPDASVSFSP